MTPVAFSLVALTLAFSTLVLWAYSKKSKSRWLEASTIIFDEPSKEQLAEQSIHKGAAHDE